MPAAGSTEYAGIAAAMPLSVRKSWQGGGKLCECQHTGEQEATVPASHAIGSAHMAQRLSPIDAMSRMQTVSSTTVLPHERPVKHGLLQENAHAGDGCKQRKQRGQGEHPLCRSRMPNTVGTALLLRYRPVHRPYTRVQRRTRSARRREDTVIRSSAAGQTAPYTTAETAADA